MLPHRLAAAICIVATSAVPLRADAPGAPASLSAMVSAQRVSLSWAAPATGDVSGYIIEAGSASGLANLAIVRVPAASPAFVTDGVPAGSYHVRVRAESAGVAGPPSNEVIVVVSGPCVPGPPSALTAAVSANTVAFSWVAPAGACAPSGYRLEAGSSSGLSNLASLALGPATAFSAHAPNGTYFVRVRALAGTTAGAASAEAVVTIGPPCTPVQPLWSVTTTGLRLTIGWGWEAAGPAVSSYLLTAGVTPSATGLAAITIPGHSPRSFAATAPPGTYYLQFSARNQCGSTSTQPIAVRFGRSYAGMSLETLLAEFTHVADRGAVRVFSTLGDWFTSAHADHGLLVWNYFAGLFARTYGPRTELYYTNDANLYAAIAAYCGGAATANARAVTTCYDRTTGVYRWVIVPYISPDFGTQLHELSHGFLYATYPESEAYPWIKEGSGMYWEGGEFVGSRFVERPPAGLANAFRGHLQRGELVPLADLVTRPRALFYSGTPGGYPQSGLFWSYLENRHPAVVASLITGLNDRTIVNNLQVLLHITQGTGMTLTELDAAYTAYTLSF